MFNGRQVKYIRPIKSYAGYGGSVNWFESQRGKFLLAIQTKFQIYKFYSGVVIFEILLKARVDHMHFDTIEMSKNFKNILFHFSENGLALLNADHPLNSYFDSDKYSIDVTQSMNLYVNDSNSKEECCSYLLTIIARFKNDQWLAFCEKNYEVVDHAFKQLDLKFLYVIYNDCITRVSPSKWEALKDRTVAKQWPFHKQRDEKFLVVEIVPRKDK
jgi:hypothetical protein